MECQFGMFTGTLPRIALPCGLIARPRTVGAADDPRALAHLPGPRPRREVPRDRSHVGVGP